MSMIEFAPEWLLNKLSHAQFTKVVVIVRVLCGVWFFRNKKVWEGKGVTASIAMDWSSKFLNDWRTTKASRTISAASCAKQCSSSIYKWRPPKQGMYKLNTDAAYKYGSNSFSIGLVLWDHLGNFIASKVVRLKMACSVIETEWLFTKD